MLAFTESVEEAMVVGADAVVAHDAIRAFFIEMHGRRG